MSLYEARHVKTNKMAGRPAKTQISQGIRVVNMQHASEPRHEKKAVFVGFRSGKNQIDLLRYRDGMTI